MRRLFCGVLALAAIVVLASVSEPTPAQAPPGQGRAPLSSTRPFLPGIPDAERGRALAQRVLDGEAAAIEELQQTGLTYVQWVIAREQTNRHALDVRYNHRDWIRAMQEWEHTLIHSTPAKVHEKFQELENRFVHKEAQLARAILYTDAYGDAQMRDRLIAIAPRSPWVRAALGWMRQGMNDRQAVDAMVEVLPEYFKLQQLTFSVLPAQLRPAASRPPTATEEGRRENFRNLHLPEGMQEIFFMPTVWRYSGLVERIGALAAEVGDDEYIKATGERVKEAAAETPFATESAAVYTMASGVLREGFEMPEHPDRYTEYATGPLLIAAGLNFSQDWQWFGRVHSSIAAFHGMPDLNITRRNYLARCFELDDPMLARLAARHVLALYDDRLHGYQDVARALLMFGNHTELAQAYGDALRASRDRNVRRLADALRRGNPRLLDNLPPDRELSMTVEQRAGILAAFSYDEEREVHGGEVGVYWMNRAVFLEGTRNLIASKEAWFEAMRVTEEHQKTDGLTATIVEFFHWCERNLTRADYETMLRDYRRRYESEVGKLPQRLLVNFQDRPQLADADKARYADFMMLHAQALDPDTYRDLSRNNRRWGGAGLMLASESALLQGRTTDRKTHYDRAVVTSPISRRLHLMVSPQNQNFGTYRTGNWHVAARHVAALTMISPFSAYTHLVSAMVHARTGEVPTGTAGLAHISTARPAMVMEAMMSVGRIWHNVYGRVHIARLFQREYAADPTRVVEGHFANELMIVFDWIFGMYNYHDVLRQSVAVSGPTNSWLNAKLQTQLNVLNMQDVNILLNMALATCTFQPDLAIRFVDRAEQRGISSYGRFVGTQALVCAHAINGTLDEVLPQYHRVRRSPGGGQADNLDMYMLCGLIRGNRYEDVDKVKEALQQHNFRPEASNTEAMWRVAHMMAGRHDRIPGLPVPENRNIVFEDAREYTRLFHEARVLLDAEDYAEIIKRSEPYMTFEIESGMGVYTDAALLRGIAQKLSSEGLPRDRRSGRLQVAPVSLVDAFLGTEAILDLHVLHMLSGQADLGPLPETSANLMWHSRLYSDRGPAAFGCLLLRGDGTAARDSFVRGVLAWFADNDDEARKHLQACMEADVRTQVDYHLAEWLLQGPLATE
jgi:hypothetical protein